VGELRFAAPIPPPDNRSAGVQDGSYGPICRQAASPVWEQVADAFVTSLSKGQTNFTPPALNFTVPKPDPRESEDCLFLDVITPRDTFQKAGNGTGGTPVLVWLYGGGYVGGDKNSAGNPAGLLLRSGINNVATPSPGVIFVAPNYRVSVSTSYRSIHPDCA
jgi:acetylcholinesterase